MPVLARRPFKFAGRDLAVGDPVVGLDGETPDGGLYRRLHNSGFIYVADEPAAEGVSGPREHKGTERQARHEQATKKAATKKDDD